MIKFKKHHSRQFVGSSYGVILELHPKRKTLAFFWNQKMFEFYTGRDY